MQRGGYISIVVEDLHFLIKSAGTSFEYNGISYKFIFRPMTKIESEGWEKCKEEIKK